MLGHKNPTRISQYVKVLEQAGIITRGQSYSKGRNGKQCSLNKWVLEALSMTLPSDAPESPLQPEIKSESIEGWLNASDLIESVWERIEPALEGVG
jgi:hypothetical protein